MAMNEMAKTADVVVIGGGIVGCATAYYLAKSGVKAVVLEKGDIAGEGSGLSGGVVRLLNKHPAEIPLMVACLKVWDSLSAELGCNARFERVGLLDVIREESKLAQVEEYSKTMRETFGVDFRVVGADKVKELVPPLQGSLLGGLYSPVDGIADDAGVTRGFAEAARKFGAEIYTNTPCWDIEVNGNAVTAVVTPKGRIKTKTMVNAAGVYAPQVARMVGFHMPAKVVRCDLSETGPMPAHFRVCVNDYWGNTCPTARGAFESAFMYAGLDHYLSFDDLQDLRLWLPVYRQVKHLTRLRVDMARLWREVKGAISPSRKARMGSKFPNFRPAPDVKGLKAGWQEVAQALPVFKDVQLARTWAGLVDMTPDALPLIGELDSPRGFLMAAGWSGHGFGSGPLVGRFMAELVVKGEASLPLNAFRPTRFSDGSMEKLDVNSMMPGSGHRPQAH